MIQVKLKRNKEGILSFELPESLDEIQLSQAVMYNNRYNDLHEWGLKNNAIDLNEEQKLQEIDLMCRCVAGYLDIDVDIIKAARLGDIDKEIESMYDSVYSIMGYLSKIMSSYSYSPPVGDVYRFNHNGMDYTIPGYYRAAVTDDTTMADLTVAEAIECLEVRRLSDRIKNKDDSKFTELIMNLAVLARVDDELLPESQYEIDEFIKERVEVFQDIKMKVAYDVAFFLTSTLRN